MLEILAEDKFYFTVTDIKQYRYCPRIIYFTYVQPVPRRVTKLMNFGKERHVETERLEPRRVVKKYGLEGGKKIFREHFKSEKLCLTGKLDLSIHTPEAVYPVEFKFTLEKEPRSNYISQLAAYALLLEEKYGKKIERGFFYLIPQKRILPVMIKEKDKEKVTESIEKMKDIIAREHFPPPAKGEGKCTDCEWKNFCGDIPVKERAMPVIGQFE